MEMDTLITMNPKAVPTQVRLILLLWRPDWWGTGSLMKAVGIWPSDSSGNNYHAQLFGAADPSRRCG